MFRSPWLRTLIVIIIVAAAILIFAPALVTSYVHHMHLKGLGHMSSGKAFIFGFLQGLLIVVNLIVSFFRHHIHIFYQHGSDAYLLGFALGFLVFLSIIFGGFRSYRR
jgi:hypothetical protein